MRKKADFVRWITCDDIQLSLTTAVHESVHLLTHEKDGYPLIEGGYCAGRRSWSDTMRPGASPAVSMRATCS